MKAHKIVFLVLILSLPLAHADDREDAVQAINEIQKIADELEKLQLSTLLIKDKLTDAKRSFGGHETSTVKKEIIAEINPERREFLDDILIVLQQTPGFELKQRDYQEVILIALEVKQIREDALIIADSLELIEELEYSYRQEEMQTEEARNLLEAAKTAASQERFADALSLMDQAEQSLSTARDEFQRQRGITELSKNFIQRYWIAIVLLLIAAGVGAKPAWKLFQKKRAEHKAKLMKMEERTITKLLRKAQHEYFVAQRITKSTFDIRIDRLKKRMTHIKHTLPVLEAIAKGQNPKKKHAVKRGVIEIKR